MKCKPRVVLCGGAVLAASAAVQAAEVWQSETAFLENVEPGFYLETFDLPGGGWLELGPSADFGPVNGFAYEISTPDVLFLWGATFTGLGSDTIGTNGPDAPVTILFTGAPVTAVGGNFFVTDVNFLPSAGSWLTIELNDGTTVVLDEPSVNHFCGFTSDVPITSLTLTPGHSGPSQFVYVTMDDIHVGSAGEGCLADVNGDNVVNVLDLLIVLNAWGAPGGTGDVNGDGVVNIMDILLLLAAWGPC